MFGRELRGKNWNESSVEKTSTYYSVCYKSTMHNVNERQQQKQTEHRIIHWICVEEK
tara:strand:- start:214 stop:384 length:171 start_codon:yes stop_codon:yes gene_type:complete